MTEEPLWGSKWEQDKKCHWQLQEGRQGCTTDSGLDKQPHHSSHTRSKLSLIAGGECCLLCTESLNVPHSETACCEDKGCRNGNVNLPNDWTAPSLLCTSCEKCGSLSSVLSVWTSRICSCLTPSLSSSSLLLCFSYSSPHPCFHLMFILPVSSKKVQINSKQQRLLRQA